MKMITERTASCSCFYVWHPDGLDFGLIAPKFSTYSEARAKADEWNKEVEGHKVYKSPTRNLQPERLLCNYKLL